MLAASDAEKDFHHHPLLGNPLWEKSTGQDAPVHTSNRIVTDPIALTVPALYHNRLQRAARAESSERPTQQADKLVPFQDEFDVGLECFHVGPPLIVELVTVDVDGFIKYLVDEFLAQKGVGRQFADATIEGH